VRFNFPQAVASDAAGNIYVADTGNHVIRLITAAGEVKTLAGLPGTRGNIDGAGAEARFNSPSGIAVASDGSIYVADSKNRTIRKISAAGVVTTIAGEATDSGLSSDGVGLAARFVEPAGLAIDPAGNLYIADRGAHVIRKMTTGREVSTIAGNPFYYGSVDGTGAVARFSSPEGIAVDSAGKLYVADSSNCTIRKIIGNEVTTFAGAAGEAYLVNGLGPQARFGFPSGITVDATGNVYVVDRGNSSLRQITPAGQVTTIISGYSYSSSEIDGDVSAARLAGPIGITVATDGSLYIADTANHSIRKVSELRTISTIAGKHAVSGYADGVGESARFSSPPAVAVDLSRNVYVADTENRVIRKIAPDGTAVVLAGEPLAFGYADGVGPQARFGLPRGIAVDAQGVVYVADAGSSTIRKISTSGVVSTLAGKSNTGGSVDGPGAEARFDSPAGVAVDLAGNVYVADFGSSTIRKITPGGVVSTLAGTAAFMSQGRVDGVGAAARFAGPTSLAVDAGGNVFVVDSGNRSIRKITPAGVVTTIAGIPNYIGDPVDGPSELATFRMPYGIAVDEAGVLYVSDGSAIRKIAPDGVVSTIAGDPLSVGSEDGLGRAARFTDMHSIAVDPLGNLYIADSGNHAIRKGSKLIVPEVEWEVAETLRPGTLLDDSHLNATSNVSGTFTYAPTAGTAVEEGPFVLGVLFTPADSESYTTFYKEVTVLGGAAKPVVSWPAPAEIVYGMPLGDLQLNATADVPGKFAYTPTAGAILDPGVRTLTATFTPDDPAAYQTASIEVNVTVTKATPVLTWPAPSPIVYGTALSDEQLNASASVPGAYIYTPKLGTLLAAGADRSLSVQFVPSDVARYKSVTGATAIDVEKARLAVSVTDKTRPYGVVTSFELSYSGFVGPDTADSLEETPTASTSATAFSAPGEYAINIEGGESSNYSFEFSPPGKLTITKALLTVTADNQARLYGVQNPSLTYRYDGFVNGENSNVLTTEPQITTDADTASVPGDYAISLSGGAAENYSFKLVDGVMSVLARDYAGAYFGEFASGGHWALLVKEDHTARYLAFLPGGHEAVSLLMIVDETGKFQITIPERLNEPGHLAGDRAARRGTGRLPRAISAEIGVSGQIGVDGTVAGELLGVEQSFVGALDVPEANAEREPSFYYAPALGSGDDLVMSIVGPSGQALVVTSSVEGNDAMQGIVDANGRLTGTTANGGQFALAINGATGALNVQLTRAGWTTPRMFAGLNEDVPAWARLTAISTRSRAGRDDRTLIMGFVIAGNGDKQLVTRGVGPSLKPVGVTDALTDPQLKLFDRFGVLIDGNDNWGGSAEMTQTFSRLGMSPGLAADSKDAALVRTTAPGVYTAHVTTGDEATGVALIEVYDGNTDSGTRFTALSTRTVTGPGEDTLIAGVVIDGNVPKRILIRGVGPLLTTQGINPANVLSDPRLAVHRFVGQSAVLIAENDDWGGLPELKTAFAAVGLSSFQSDTSKDAALLLTLEPGVYTVQLGGGNNTSGVALIEVYEAP
jgi:sugar lactone lactonase YvrE